MKDGHVLEVPSETPGVQDLVAREEANACTATQRQEQLEQADAECVPGRRAEPVAGQEAVGSTSGVEVVREVGVGSNDSFGSPGRAGGEEQVAMLIDSHLDLGKRGLAPREIQLDGVEMHLRQARRKETIGQLAVGQYERRLRLFEHLGDQGGRMGWVDWHVHSASLPGGQHCDQRMQ